MEIIFIQISVKSSEDGEIPRGEIAIGGEIRQKTG